MLETSNSYRYGTIDFHDFMLLWSVLSLSLKAYETDDSCLHRLNSKHSLRPDIPAGNPVWAAALGGKLTGPRVKLVYCRLDGFTFHGQDATPDEAPAFASLLRDQRFSDYMV